jgi:hypothetical protein
MTLIHLSSVLNTSVYEILPVNEATYLSQKPRPLTLLIEKTHHTEHSFTTVPAKTTNNRKINSDCNNPTRFAWLAIVGQADWRKEGKVIAVLV